MRLRSVKSGIFHRSGCDYIQDWMRLVSEYTEEDATGFGGGAAMKRLRFGADRQKNSAGQMVRLDAKVE